MPEEILEISKIRKSVGLEIEEFDEELRQLEQAAIKKLLPSKITLEDNLICSTILAYIKSQFRFSDKDIAMRFQEVFEENKNFMCSTKEYTEKGEKNG
mgnify:CR=1 FL=1